MEEEPKFTDKVAQSSKQQQLPHDLIAENILTRSPIKSLLQWKCVSKQWYSCLSSYHFTNTHFKLSPFYPSSSPTQFLFIQHTHNFYLLHCNDDDENGNITNNTLNNLMKLRFDFDDDELVLIGSCNGLVCLASFSGYYFILWNPIAGKFHKYLDTEILVDCSSNSRVSWGFGYVSSTDDYKIVRVLELRNTSEIVVHVFSMKSNKWTRIADDVYKDIFSLGTTEHQVVEFDGGDVLLRFPYVFHSRQGVLADEMLYWIVSDTHDLGRKIVAFDLVLERFDTVIDMKLVSKNIYRDKFLCIIAGCLAKCGVNIDDDVYIDVLKGPGEVESSIRFPRNLRLRSCQSFVGFTRTGKIFVLLEDSTIGIVDRRSKPMKCTPLVTFGRLGKSRVVNYVPSLLLPQIVA